MQSFRRVSYKSKHQNSRFLGRFNVCFRTCSCGINLNGEQHINWHDCLADQGWRCLCTKSPNKNIDWGTASFVKIHRPQPVIEGFCVSDVAMEFPARVYSMGLSRLAMKMLSRGSLVDHSTEIFKISDRFSLFIILYIYKK